MTAMLALLLAQEEDPSSLLGAALKWGPFALVVVMATLGYIRFKPEVDALSESNRSTAEALNRLAAAYQTLDTRMAAMQKLAEVGLDTAARSGLIDKRELARVHDEARITELRIAESRLNPPTTGQETI